MANKNVFCAGKDQSYSLTRVHTKIKFCNRWEAGSPLIQSIHDYCLWMCNCVALGPLYEQYESSYARKSILRAPNAHRRQLMGKLCNYI